MHTSDDAVGSSPHTRGALGDLLVDLLDDRIIPAYAGSTSTATTPGPQGRDHPRIRGEHDPCPLADCATVGSSPHTRGARTSPPEVIAEWGIIPAYAGSTPASGPTSPAPPDHPRIRGEHGRLVRCLLRQRGSSPHTRGARSGRHLTPHRRHGSSPHTRGAHVIGPGCAAAGGIIPAYAGSTLFEDEFVEDEGDHPRIRGEHAGRPKPPRASDGSSPHTRGARGRVHRHRRPVRIIPAYAGSTQPFGKEEYRSRDHPRIRGEHHLGASMCTSASGSSPHTRGARNELEANVNKTGIIPAYAGSTSARSEPSFSTKDHPRIRGEHPEGGGRPAISGGSSPHTRGAPHGLGSPRGARRIIPAYAGSTLSALVLSSRATDHPRIRGEHEDGAIHGAVKAGSSPHTRGAHEHRFPARSRRGIIPAYAGSTCRRSSRFSPEADHPRIRGEHGMLGRRLPVSGGSSPHTRGALPFGDFGHVVDGIIPAYAGSTKVLVPASFVSSDHPRIRGEHHDHPLRRPQSRRIIPAYAGSTPIGRRSAGASADHPRIRGEHTQNSTHHLSCGGSSPHTRGAQAFHRV